MQDFEILAPVKDEENFFQAINNGADAVYLGLTDFNARQKASNFSAENLKKTIDYAHFLGVKVYITLNTIVVDNEIDKLINLVSSAIDCGADAFIVQDLGVAKLLKSCFKNIVLHGSTQMGIHNLYGAKVCQQMGLSRIVLSRETTIEDIKEIKANTNLELEFFVQGALCVAFSGACYLSSVKHSCSGNRGKCLQLCRLNYSAEDKNINKKGYFLSPTDLCFIDKLKFLYQLGITSFKIEGRLRRPSYVALTSKYFSLAKNCILKNIPFNQSEYLSFIKKVFYRGEYNNGLYFEKEPQQNIINTEFQNHRGILVGRVLKVEPFKDIFKIKLSSSHKITKNDGLKFVNKNNNELSMGVGSVTQTKNKEYEVFSKVCPNINDDVYLTVDSEWEQALLNNKRTLDFDAYFDAKTNNTPKLVLMCKNTKVEVESDFVLQEAKNQGLTEQEVVDCLQKTDNLPIKLNNLKCSLQNVFIPKAKLNELRRNAFEKLFCEVVKNYNLNNFSKSCCDLQELKKIKESALKELFENNNFVCVNETLLKQKEKLKDYANYKLVLSPANFELDNIKSCFNTAKSLGFDSFYLDLPKVARYKDFLKIKNIVLNLPQEIGLIANNIYAINFVNKNREVVGGVYLNIANSFSALALKQLGIKTFVKSFEDFACDFDKGLTYEGRPALMTFCHCPYKTVYKNDSCLNCKYTGSLTYKDDSQNRFEIRRVKIENCNFELVDNMIINQNFYGNKFIDLR